MTKKGRMMHSVAISFVAALVVGCATLPPGSDFPKVASSALTRPEETSLGRQFEDAAKSHQGNSAFRLISAGVDGFLARAQMIDAAERALDLEYYIFRQDETGQLLTEALLRAADRGVRVRLLVDDGDTLQGDERIGALAAHSNIEIRIFNPFSYRGHVELLRAVEFALNAPRLDYRMHNKLLVVDNAIALVGGRNVGDQYFQVDWESQFGDDDVFVAGPIVRELSGTFDEFWNSDLAIPVVGLGDGKSSDAALISYRRALEDNRREVKAFGAKYAKQIASGDPLAGILSGSRPLEWARAQVVYDSPNKKRVAKGEMIGSLMHKTVAETVASVQTEFLMITPYLLPAQDGMRVFKDLRKRNVRVRILTNSLESNPEPLAHSGYMKYRVPMLMEGVELYEVRSQLGSARGSGESPALASSGNYALHAKLFVFDRQKLYVGSMNFDQRSHHLNTEIGLIIDSPELARQTAARFEAIVVPANCYELALRKAPMGGLPEVIWRTREGDGDIEYEVEPANSAWQRVKVDFFSLLPLDREL